MMTRKRESLQQALTEERVEALERDVAEAIRARDLEVARLVLEEAKQRRADECDGEHAIHHPLQYGGSCSVEPCKAQRQPDQQRVEHDQSNPPATAARR